MSKQYIHKPVVFNMANPYHRKVFEWLTSETTNYSGYIFDTLAMRYEGFSLKSNINVIKNNDKDLIRGMM